LAAELFFEEERAMDSILADVKTISSTNKAFASPAAGGMKKLTTAVTAGNCIGKLARGPDPASVIPMKLEQG
jgi:uncharacterized Ntn-hydrolase superfamily protein